MISPVNPLPSYTVYRPSAVDGTDNDSALLPTVAVSLSENAGVVATLGGAKSSTQVYTANGLLNAIEQAGTLPAPVTTPEPGSYHPGQEQLAQDQLIAATLTQSPLVSGAFTGAPLLPVLSGAPASASWANALKTRPGLAGTAVDYAYNQSIVSSFSTYA